MAKVLVPLAQGCEELEAITIMDILDRGGVEVVSAGLEPGPVVAGHGTTIVPSKTLDEALKDSYDMVAMPGGLPGADHLANDARLNALLCEMAGAGKYVAAVCAAPRVLAKAGILDGRRATAYPGFIETGNFPQVNYTGSPLEVDGNVITSRGPGTAMDFALQLVEVLQGPETRQAVEKALVRP